MISKANQSRPRLVYVPDEVGKGLPQHRGVRMDADAEGGWFEVVLPPRLHERQVEGIRHLIDQSDRPSQNFGDF